MMNETAITGIVKTQLPPNFQVELIPNADHYDIEIFTPNRVLGIRLMVVENVLNRPTSLRVIGRMASHAFANGTWAMIDGQHCN